jgi:multidrug efflux system outer membrane protein
MSKLIPLILATALLAGCAVGPNYEAPRVTSIAAFRHSDRPDFSVAAPDTQWWSHFRDPVLDALIADALKRNHDLRIAQASLAEARALRRHAQWAFAPAGAAAADLQRGRPSAVESHGSRPVTGETWSAGFDAAWELDVFGRTRRTVEAATAEVGMGDATLRDVQVTLLAEVAANYFGLRQAEEGTRLVRAQLATLRESHGLTQRRVDAGRGTALDTARTEALLRETEALLPDVERRVSEHQHRLAVLVGVSPGDLTMAPKPTASPVSGPVRIGAPADLLRRRPDVQRAERALAAATAHVGVSTAALFPEISVQGFFRFVGLSAGDLGEAATRSWAVAPTIRWRLLDYGRLQAQLGASRARADGALAHYEKTVLRALEETENAFKHYAAALDRSASLEARHAAAERARVLATQQYEAGSSDPLARLDAERLALAAARDVIAVHTERQLALVMLYKALGGGWSAAPASTPEALMAAH